MLLLKEIARRIHQNFIAREGDSIIHERANRAKCFVAEKPLADPNAAYSDFKALKLPKRSHLKVNEAEELIQNGKMFFLGKDRYLMLAHNTHLSRSGRNISVVHGRSIRSPNEFLFVAYPEKQDMGRFRRASFDLSLGGGPGDYFHGSLGVVELVLQKGGIAQVSFIQSSVNIPQAIRSGALPERYRRLYSGWASCLVNNVFAAAANAGWSLVHLPKGRVTAGLGEAQLNTLAEPWGYKIAGFNPDHLFLEPEPDITFVRVCRRNWKA
jgi:hypothetical protein